MGVVLLVEVEVIVGKAKAIHNVENTRKTRRRITRMRAPHPLAVRRGASVVVRTSLYHEKDPTQPQKSWVSLGKVRPDTILFRIPEICLLFPKIFLAPRGQQKKVGDRSGRLHTKRECYTWKKQLLKGLTLDISCELW